MSDKPIIMAATNVQALLAGRKTQTRRLMRQQEALSRMYSPIIINRSVYNYSGEELIDQAQHNFGDRLWVKELWRPFSIPHSPWDLEVAYAADGECRIIKDGEFGERDWTFPKAAARGNVTPLFMPRWASRITLVVTDVRVQRLQDITEEDAIAEGLRWIRYEELFPDGGDPQYHGTGGWEAHQTYPDGTAHPHNLAPLKSAVKAYEYLWDTLHRKDAPWETNPWVAAYTFETHIGNIDSFGQKN